MISEQKLELLCLRCIINDCINDHVYEEWVRENYDFDKLYKRYTELGTNLLYPYKKLDNVES